MKFYVYENAGRPKKDQWDEDKVFQTLSTAEPKSSAILCRDPEQAAFLQGLQLMYGTEVFIGSYIEWQDRRKTTPFNNPFPRWIFSLEPIPY